MYKKYSTILYIVLVASCSKAPDYKKLETSYDPIEPFNRAMFTVNLVTDRYLFRPLALGYTAIMPDIAERGLHDAITNAYEPFNIVNLLLQGRINDAHISWVRFFTNSTVGILGLWDPATKLGAPKFDEDFGQTLAVWGVGNGPYIILPFMGPSNVRDALGMIGHIMTPLSPTHNWSTDHDIIYYGINLFDTRVGLLRTDDMMQRQPDLYSFLRSIYTDNRAKLIYDNRTIPQEEQEDLLDFLDN